MSRSSHSRVRLAVATIAALLGSPSVGRAAGHPEAREAVLWGRSELPAALAGPSSRYRVVRRASASVVVARVDARAIDAGDLARLRTASRGAAVTRAFKFAFVSSSSTSGCVLAADASALTPGGPLPVTARPLASALRCTEGGSPACGRGDRTQLWGQERVGADLVAPDQASGAYPASATRVAVIDTGFDLAGQGARMGTVRIAGTRPGAGDPTRDPTGHGTAVAGLIGGRDGIGIAPRSDLTSYRVDADGAGAGVVDADRLIESVRQACRDGNEVINVSWGAAADEEGHLRDEENVAFRTLLRELSERGCLVVKAAGNGGFRGRHGSDDPDDAYLRVEATRPDGDLAGFSSSGEIAAPGAGVFSLLSSAHGNLVARHSDASSCGDPRGGLVQGTSFAAPIVAAVASRVIEALRQSGGRAYDALPGRERVRLVNRILRASSFGGSVRLPRALAIARRWGERPVTPVPAAAALLDSLTSSPEARCRATAPTCRADDACSRLRPCLTAERLRASLCPSLQEATAARLYETALRNDALADAEAARRSAAPARSVRTDARVERLWDAWIDRWTAGQPAGLSSQARREWVRREMDLEPARELLPAIIQTRPATAAGRTAAEELALDFLGGLKFAEEAAREAALASGERIWVGGDLAEATLDLLWAVHVKVGARRFPGFLRRWAQEREASGRPSAPFDWLARTLARQARARRLPDAFVRTLEDLARLPFRR